MTYYDRLNGFFRANEYDPLPASAQLLYLHLLHINNVTGNTGQFRCTDRRLADLTRLNKNTITEAKRLLKNKNYLDFKTVKNNTHAGTIYFLPDSAKPEIPQAPTQPPQQKKSYLSTNTPEVVKAWDDWGGVRLNGGVAFELIQLENSYGTQKLLAAIETAGKSNNRHNLSLNFLKAVLEGRIPNATPVRRTEQAESWEQQRPDWLDG